MQAGKKIPKWDIRARMGIYLGMSMQHARSVALVLNMGTGHVSPQFHVKLDPKFETVRCSLENISPESKWQIECGFKERLKKISNPTITVGRPPTEAPKLEHSTPEEDLFQQLTTDPSPSDDRTVDHSEKEALNTQLRSSKRALNSCLWSVYRPWYHVLTWSNERAWQGTIPKSNATGGGEPYPESSMGNGSKITSSRGSPDITFSLSHEAKKKDFN
jgi:hypothetical protein